MFDINTIINAAIADAVKAAVTEALSKLDTRITALEDNPAQGTDMSLVHRITALETKLAEAKLFEQTTNVTPLIDEAKMVEALDSQKWFWEKLARKTMMAAEAAAEEAIYAHCQDYDHDDYDRVVGDVHGADLDDIVTKSEVEQMVRETMENATISISV